MERESVLCGRRRVPAQGWYRLRQDMLSPTDADQSVTTGAKIRGGATWGGGHVDGLGDPRQVFGSRSLVCPSGRSSSGFANLENPIPMEIMSFAACCRTRLCDRVPDRSSSPLTKMPCPCSTHQRAKDQQSQRRSSHLMIPHGSWAHAGTTISVHFSDPPHPVGRP